MRIFCWLMLLVVFTLGPLIRGEAKVKEMESILGSNLLYIQAAIPEIENKKVDLNLYRLSVIEEADFITIVLLDKNASRGSSTRGNPGKVPGIEIQLDRKSKKILKSNYVR